MRLQHRKALVADQPRGLLKDDRIGMDIVDPARNAYPELRDKSYFKVEAVALSSWLVILLLQLNRILACS